MPALRSHLVRATAATALAITLAMSSTIVPIPALAPRIVTADTTAPEAFFIETSYLATYNHAVLWVWEVIDPTSIPDPGDFAVWIDGAGAPEPAIDVDFVYQGLVGSPLLVDVGLAQGTAFLEIRWSTPVPAGTSIHFDYTPGDHPIRDLAGNELPAMVQAEFIPLDALDFLPVVGFVDEGAGPETLVLFFGEPLTAAAPAPSEFDLWIDGIPVGNPSAIERRAAHLGATFLYLTLPSVEPGAPVRVAYTPGSLLDRNGDPIAAFDIEAFVSLASTPTRQTIAGPNVEVIPPDSTTGAQLATITFDLVTAAGSTSLTTTEVAPPLPAGFQVGDPPTYYDISTTATFSGPATVCIRYGAADYVDPGGLTLLHFRDGAWEPAANQSVDLGTQTICGEVTSFSPFAVAESPYEFTGFFSPVDNPPIVNGATAGRAIPVKFSLDGDHGLGIFAPGSPTSRRIACPSEADVDPVEQTVSTSGPPLTYEAGSDRYAFIWRTDRAWRGTCRELVLRFGDGNIETALFSFR